MSAYPTGRYQRYRVPSILRRICPDGAAHSLQDIPPDALFRAGKRLVLLDVDNTIVGWRSHAIPPETLAWIQEAKSIGLNLCLISNTRNPKRLESFAETLGIRALRGKFKPSPVMYHQALKEFGNTAEQAVMIGDQLFTDVLGANRAGIEAIWIKPMTSRDFVGTKISRMGERIVRRALNRHIEPGPTVAATASAPEPNTAAAGLPELLEHPGVRQFIKFGVVGGTSFILDAGLHWLLMFGLTVGGTTLIAGIGDDLGSWLRGQYPSIFAFASENSKAANPVLKVLTASVAILNSFFWNRRWTFGIRGAEQRFGQLRRFIIISLLGMVINTAIVSALYTIIPGHPKRSWAVATIIATIIVAFWNFFGQKLFAFKQSEAQA